MINDARPVAFCAGLWRPRVYITSGALARSDAPALAVVLAHERQHARRRDPLRLAARKVIVRSLFFLPAVRELHRGHQILAEVSADESAVSDAAGDRSTLARAMLSFTDVPEARGWSGVDPARVGYLLREPACSGALDPPFLSAQPCVVILAAIPCGIALIAARFRRVGRQR